MIVDKRLHFGRLVRSNLPALAILITYDIAVTVAYCVLDWRVVSLPELPLPLLGSAIALIVSIRNTAAYGRWWEARSLWGSIVNESRNFARGLVTLANDAELHRRLVRCQIAYVLALRCRLLRQKLDPAIDRYLPPELEEACRSVANVPLAIQLGIARDLRAARAAGTLDSVAAASLDLTLGNLMSAQGGLDRIKGTPLPRQYSLLPLIFIRAYCIVLPLGAVANLGFATALGSGVIGFMFLVLDEVGRDLEDPFENRAYDVPMASITRTIEIDLLQAIGATEIPEPIGPSKGILM
jgi:putative membrane protein